MMPLCVVPRMQSVANSPTLPGRISKAYFLTWLSVLTAIFRTGKTEDVYLFPLLNEILCALDGLRLFASIWIHLQIYDQTSVPGSADLF